VWEHAVYEELPEVVYRIRNAFEISETESAPDWRVVAVEAIDDLDRTERRHLEELRNPMIKKTEEGRRVTAKWRRLGNE
jgi:hypothetical protein